MCIADKTLLFSTYLCFFKTLGQKRAPNRNLKGKKNPQNQNSWRVFSTHLQLLYSWEVVLPSSFSQLRWPLNQQLLLLSVKAYLIKKVLNIIPNEIDLTSKTERFWQYCSTRSVFCRGQSLLAHLYCAAQNILTQKTLTSCSLFCAAALDLPRWCDVLLMVDLNGAGTKICPAGRGWISPVKARCYP